MENLNTIVKKIDIDNRIIRLINKEVLLPSYIDDFNNIDDYWYPHPPSLIPLFLGHGASYKGVIKHFFLKRENTYVEYFLEQGYISEIARNADQLITLIVLKMIITKDSLTDEIIDVCKKLDYNVYNQVDNFTVDYGDDPQEFKNLVFFDQHPPFKHIKNLNDYDGEFPSSIYILNKSSILREASLFEIAPVEKLEEIDDLPPWLSLKENKKELFNKYLSNNQLKEAWLTLNSKGWLLKDVAEALELLKKRADDELFTLVADNWINGWKKSTFLESNY